MSTSPLAEPVAEPSRSPVPAQPAVLGEVLLRDPAREVPRAPFTVETAADRATHEAYRRLRHEAFVVDQGLFAGHDRDDADDDPRTVVLVARTAAGEVVGGVRLGPVHSMPAGPGLRRTRAGGDIGRDIGWWQGSRLVTDQRHPAAAGAGAALVRAACARGEAAGALRFDAIVQTRHRDFFTRLGWVPVRPAFVEGARGAGGAVPHVLMRWPIDRVGALVGATKRDLGGLLAGLMPGPAGFVGDDGAPVPGSDVVAACDAILPSMVERDPEWAGWCSVLVNVNDLAAMGAEPVGLLDAVGARDRSFATRILAGLRDASRAYGVPVLGGHTQLGVPASLAVTALGRTARPVRGGGGRPGHRVRLTADLGGGWRPGYTGRQWDSTTTRDTWQLRDLAGSVARARPAAAKDVSMAGIAGTLGMLAEAAGCGAVLDVAAVPRPAGASVGDWLTCFPGFAMLTADDAGRDLPRACAAASADCGELVPGDGVRLRWPDGEEIRVIDGGVTGLGTA